MNTSSYRGRFAPSPTGDLHLGSLVAAMASYLDARAQRGHWLLRIENLDPPREVPGSAERIIEQLLLLGFQWDEPVSYQSERNSLYEAALQQLIEQQQAYPCTCSRSQIAQSAHEGLEGPVYPGTCRNGPAGSRPIPALRVRTDEQPIEFVDRIAGTQRYNLERDFGDFVIRRADGLFAYQLAVVVDDAAQGISHVVRGEDLLLSTPRQIHLQHLLGLPQPHYAHVPLVRDAKGEKLSKSGGSQGLDFADPLATLLRGWRHLQQGSPPPALSSIEAFWDWAIAHWTLN